jgi:hypothetical protein
VSCYSAQNFVQNLTLQDRPMAFTASDIVSLSQARANFSELADQVKAGAEKIVTKNLEKIIVVGINK